MELDRGLVGCEFRGVCVDRLPMALATGIDVEPSDAVIYANDFDKAWEYGEFPKIVLALRLEALVRTHQQVSADTPPERWRSLFVFVRHDEDLETVKANLA